MYNRQILSRPPKCFSFWLQVKVESFCIRHFPPHYLPKDPLNKTIFWDTTLQWMVHMRVLSSHGVLFLGREIELE